MTAETPQEFTFQAESSNWLHLLSHSLYHEPRDRDPRVSVERSDAASDKFRHLTLVNSEIKTDEPLEITVEPKRVRRLLIIRDNGIGMTRDELIRNLGTIAHSGSLGS